MPDDPIFDRASVYEEEGAVVYRASSLGFCTGALVRARMGVTGSAPPDLMQQRYDEGHDWEARVIAAGLGVDWTLLDARKLAQYGTVVEGEHGEVQMETEITWGTEPRKVVRCHPDGIAIHGSRAIDGAEGNMERRVVEAKFFGPDLFYATVSGGLDYKYRMQLSIEMLSTGLPALYIIGKKERAENGEVTLGEVCVEEYDTPPMALAEIKMRVLEVEGWYARGELPPCVVPFDYPCAYWADHDAPEKVSIDDDQMQKLVASYEIAVEEKEYVDEAVKLLRGQMLDRMQTLGIKGGECAGWIVSVVAPEKGNVSWSAAYKELSKQTGVQVDVEKLRGKVGEVHVRLSKEKDDAAE